MSIAPARSAARGGGVSHRPVARRYDLRWSGLLYVITLVFVAVGAFNGQNNLLFIVFSVGVAGLIVSGVISGTALMGLSLSREIVGEMRVGAPSTVRYTVTNRNTVVPVFALVIEEERAQGQRLAVPSVAVMHCPARGSVTVAVEAVPGRRGHTRVDKVRVASSFPFGLFRKMLVFDLPERITVLPAAIELSTSVSLLDRTAAGHALAGQRAGPRGEEFYGVREYVPGDPMRTIAWRRSAASDQLVVRIDAAPSPPSVWVELEHPGGPIDAWHAERAVALADAVCRELHDDRRAVGIWCDWTGVICRPSRGTRASAAGSRALALLDFDSAVHEPHTKPRGQRITIKLGGGRSQRGVLRTLTPERWLRQGSKLPSMLRPREQAGVPEPPRGAG